MSDRHRLLTVLMVIVGIILLLPGICSLVFIGVAKNAGGNVLAGEGPWGLWLTCFVISAGGIALLVAAAR